MRSARVLIYAGGVMILVLGAVVILALTTSLRRTHAQGWTAVASMHMARDEFATAQVDGKIYAIGGMTGARGTALSTNEVYDTATDTWKELPPLPVARRAVRAAAIGHRIYVVGGTMADDQTVARVDVFDTDRDTWNQTTAMPTAVESAGVIASGQYLYVFGGLSNSGKTVNSVYQLDTSTGAWRTLAPMPTTRSEAGIALLDGGIYVIGGAGDRGPVANVERFDIAKGVWSEVTALPEPMMNLGATTLNGEIHALLEGVHVVYSPTSNRWTTSRPMETARHGFGIAAVGRNLYVIGGCDQDLLDVALTEVLHT